MNRLEMIYQGNDIEIYVRSDLINTEYFVTNHSKVIARYNDNKLKYMIIECKNVQFNHLAIFHDVVVDYVLNGVI